MYSAALATLEIRERPVKTVDKIWEVLYCMPVDTFVDYQRLWSL